MTKKNSLHILILAVKDVFNRGLFLLLTSFVSSLYFRCSVMKAFTDKFTNQHKTLQLILYRCKPQDKTDIA